MPETRVVQLRDVGPLHGVLLRACPPNKSGVASVRVLAEWLGMTPAGVYKWIHRGEVPASRVPELLRLQREHFGEVRVREGELNPIFC